LPRNGRAASRPIALPRSRAALASARSWDTSARSPPTAGRA
jgi:hypothetical protein